MLNVFAVFIGGGIGAMMRYLSSVVVQHFVKVNLPLVTFIVNILGCFVLGYLYVSFVEKVSCSNATKLALTVGFCGGLTTFSTFSLEIFKMIQNNQFMLALLYILLSVMLGVLAVYAGGYCARFL